jgi:hypothetical protein
MTFSQKEETSLHCSSSSNILLIREGREKSSPTTAVRKMLLNGRVNMWMQHDGAPPHYALSQQVRNEMFRDK